MRVYLFIVSRTSAFVKALLPRLALFCFRIWRYFASAFGARSLPRLRFFEPEKDYLEIIPKSYYNDDNDDNDDSGVA
jgi:hypothetical protein